MGPKGRMKQRSGAILVFLLGYKFVDLIMNGRFSVCEPAMTGVRV